MKINRFYVLTITLLALSSAQVSNAETIKCEGYKTDPLKLVKIGTKLKISEGTIACSSPETYIEFLESVWTGEKKRAATLVNNRMCTEPGAGGAKLTVAAIKQYPNGCLMLLRTPPQLNAGGTWTDIGGVSELFPN